MAKTNRNREEHRYYLLPGMGPSNRRWRRKVFRASIIVALIFSAFFGLVIWLLNQRW